jgi:uncharacterized protein YqgV (UPF0045/DUF77 family)
VKLTAELSLYPLHENYIEIITAFIDNARKYNDITLVTNAMSTQVCGDYQRVMDLIGQVLLKSYNTFGKQVLVCKFIPGELALK